MVGIIRRAHWPTALCIKQFADWSGNLFWHGVLTKDLLEETMDPSQKRSVKKIQQTMKEFLQQDEKSIDKHMAISRALTDLNLSANNLEDKYQQFLSNGKAQSNAFHFWHEYLFK